ncbi:UNVERIFIED_CONTAM: hypothetical protein QE387_002271 [Pseudacidovorax intermedius]|nr:hypothetical protein [Pseudacidovorax intermedius]
MEKPLILVTNDDGITAPGIRNLVSFMNEIGDVIVVAPQLTAKRKRPCDYHQFYTEL